MPLICQCAEDYALYDKIKSFLKKDPNQNLTIEDQSKVIDLAEKSGLLLEFNQNQASIAVPLFSKDIDDNVIKEEVKKDVYRLTSILGWYFGGYVDIDQSKDFNQKSPISFIRHANVVKYSMTNSLNDFNPSLPIINDEKDKLALAFWREGLKLKDIHAGFAFLSFYKAIESQFTAKDNRETGKGCKKWIIDNLELIPDNTRAGRRINALLSQKGSFEEVRDHLFLSVRCAIAHASCDQKIINPDIPSNKEELVLDLPIMEALAERYIRVEKNIGSLYMQRCNQTIY
jgi:hypothetical protein